MPEKLSPKYYFEIASMLLIIAVVSMLSGHLALGGLAIVACVLMLTAYHKESRRRRGS